MRWRKTSGLMATVQCAGCASKLPPAALEEALRHLPRTADPRLLLGHLHADDAGIIALTAAELGGIDAKAMSIAVALAASAGFSAPIGSSPNLLVYGPGGYKYLDYTRVGIGLNALLLVLAVSLLPFIWPL